MRILERGTIPTERIHIARCDVCSTKVEFQRKEANLVVDPETSLQRVEIECPVCKATIKDRIRSGEA
jgi:uncharacterized protein with PIN domain